jgi:hypothetical protein
MFIFVSVLHKVDSGGIFCSKQRHQKDKSELLKNLGSDSL